jgi:hypothetical protein
VARRLFPNNLRVSREDIPNRNRKVHQREEVDSGYPTNGPESEGVDMVPGFSSPDSYI